MTTEDLRTPKQKYEERKAARKASDSSASAQRELELLDIIDRFATAIERIADTIEVAHAKV